MLFFSDFLGKIQVREIGRSLAKLLQYGTLNMELVHSMVTITFFSRIKQQFFFVIENNYCIIVPICVITNQVLDYFRLFSDLDLE